MSGKLSGKKVAIIAAQEFEDIELLYPVLRLSEEGAEIIVVPVNEGLHTRPHIPNKPVTGRFGHTIPIPVMEEGKRYKVKNIDDISPDEVDCVLFPGGFSPDTLRWHEKTLEFTKECNRKGKIIAAICHGHRF